MIPFGTDMPGGPFDDRAYLAEYGSTRAQEFFDLTVAASPRGFANVLSVVGRRPAAAIREDVAYVICRILTAPGYVDRVEAVIGSVVDHITALVENAGQRDQPEPAPPEAGAWFTFLDVALVAAGVVALGDEIIERRREQGR